MTTKITFCGIYRKGVEYLISFRFVFSKVTKYSSTPLRYTTESDLCRHILNNLKDIIEVCGLDDNVEVTSEFELVGLQNDIC
jgi:hypothetical protein